MAEAISIPRRDRRQLAHGFDSLRREGIRLAQQLSGKQWTDYNLHDPGVTILEQLVYALTDIIYRAGFPVADYLADARGEIDYEGLGLQRPEQVFPCRPGTVLDYRKALLDAIAELDNVWVLPLVPAELGSGAVRGLYRIAVKLEQGLEPAAQQAVVERVRRCYQGWRNLGEDVADITVVTGVDYRLCAEIEVDSARRPADILAEIYFSCARRIAGGITLYDYDSVSGAGGGLEDLFSGPYTEHGFFKDEELGPGQAEFQLASLYSSINAVAGVDHLRQLYLQRDGERFYDVIASASPETSFNLEIPQRDEDIGIVLTTNGRVLPVAADELRAKFDELNFRYHAMRTGLQPLTQVYRLPEAVARPLAEYASIQPHFPAAYNIGHYGVPDSAPPQVKARARQLKGYLVLFEQLLANAAANLDNIRQLFSQDDPPARSYAVMPLSEAQIPGLRDVYPETAAGRLEQIVARFDDFRERQSRLLDYLLALYGESFSQHSLRHFNDYYSQEEVEQLIVDNKRAFLRSIVALNRDRAAAADYGAEAWATRAGSGLQRRVSLLLGFRNTQARSLTMALMKQGLKLTRHEVYEQLKEGSPELEFVDAARLDEAGFEPVPLCQPGDAQQAEAAEPLLEEIAPLKNNTLSDTLLRGGIHLSHYRLGSLTSGRDYQLTFLDAQGRAWYLATLPDRETGIDIANRLRRFLILLNEQSEGLHLLEHLLLRPQGDKRHAGLALPGNEDFYSYRMSVIFPAWTARCQRRQFRLLAEETLRLNSPAHLFAQFYWLDFHKMYEFELLYEKWLSLKAQDGGEVQALDQASAALIRFLLDNRMDSGVDNGMGIGGEA